VVPAPVLAQTAWLIESRLGPDAEAAFLRLVTSGEVEVVALIVEDADRNVLGLLQSR
jgi:hypothetical protein